MAGDDDDLRALIRDLRDQLARALEDGAAARAQLAQLTAILAQQAGSIAQLAARPAAGAAADQTTTIGEIYKAYSAERKGEHSWRWIEDKLAPLVRRLGDLPAMKLTPKRWAEHRRDRLGETARKDLPPSKTTLNLELARAKTMLSWAARREQELIPSNPLRDAKRDKPNAPRKTWLPEPDIDRLLHAPLPASPRARQFVRAFTVTKADTGLRFDEVRTLRRDRVRVIDDDEVLADIEQTKNDKSHVVGLTKRSYRALEAIPEVEGSPYYLANPATGRLFSPSTLWRWFREACKSSGIDAMVADGEVRVRPHDLRRSAATNAHARGATLPEVQDMLNHTNIGVTAQYVQRNERNAVRVAKLMEKGAAEEMEKANRSRRGPRRAEKNQQLEIPITTSERMGSA